MLILPTASSLVETERAQRLFAEVAAQRVHCTLVVFRDGARPREIASRADVLTANHAFRRVVWIPDVSVLAGVAEFARLLELDSAGEEAVALTVQFQPSSCLRGVDATKRHKLELAFADALAGKLLS